MQKKSTITDALTRKFPEQVVIAIARDSKGKHNPITLGWTMITSHEPPMMAISIGKTRWTLEAVRLSRQFVISMPSAQMVKDAEFHGSNSGRDMDKLAECPTATQPATKIDSVLLSDAVANFECELRHELETGDHVLFVGEVVAAHVNEDELLGRLYTRGKDLAMGGVKPILD